MGMCEENMMYGKQTIREEDRVAYGVEDAAALVGLSARYVRDLIAQGQMKSFKVGRRVLVSRKALIEFTEKQG